MKRRSIISLLVLCFVAGIGMMGLYVYNQQKPKETPKAQKEQTLVKKEISVNEEKTKENLIKEPDSADVDSVLDQAVPTGGVVDSTIQVQPKDEEYDEIDPMVTTQVLAEQKVEPTLNFTQEDGMLWPVSGDVLMNYSVDNTIYFATLDQYKANPAIMIDSEVNTKVQAGASGKVVSIETSEVTGTTLVMDMGNGYQATYGQLKELAVEVGDLVDKGETVGYVSEPTKYFSVEGCNLYVQLKKDEANVNPMDYLK